ncbi:hypothetical protein ACO0LF_17455 [Undibacterium sp. Di27W]|uniref:hypothetical protein n=1 Tax=Undibacterium sp. Di27W TaxID=3413036 RepID=UPI003BF1B962
MKTRLNLLAKLAIATTLLANVMAAGAAPLAVSNLDAQLISYFRPYAPAAEVLVKKVQKNLPAEKTEASTKVADKNKAGNDTQICTETESDKAMEAEGLPGKQSGMLKMP